MLATKALDDYDQIRTKARREMFDLLTAEPEPVATKAVKLPVQVRAAHAAATNVGD